MRLASLRCSSGVVGLLIVVGVAGAFVWVNLPLAPDPAWMPYPISVVPLPNLLYEDGAFSGPWVGDLQYTDGYWYMGDGRGGIWRSENGALWKRASVTHDGVRRSMQNAPTRSINRSANGTYIATFLGGGSLVWPAAQRPLGMQDRQHAPIARSIDGLHWDVKNLPESCGIHFSATDGQGTWIAPGCEDRLLVSKDDGRSWLLRKTGLPARLNAQGYKDGVWVVGAGTGSEGGIYSSRDLVHWKKTLALPAGVTPKRTLLLHGRLVMTGNRRFIASSANGIDWRARFTVAGQGATMRAGVWHPTIGYILAGTHGQVMYSRDLTSWFCGSIGLKTKITGMAISRAGKVLASSLPAFLYRLMPGYLDLHREGYSCPPSSVSHEARSSS